MNFITRGTIYYADLNPVQGSEQGGIRPVLVIQNNTGNKFSPTVIISPITSRKKARLPTHVMVSKFNGLEDSSIVLLEQIRTIDKRRIRDCIGKLDADNMKKVDYGLATSIGLHGFLGNHLIMTLCSVCLKQFMEDEEHFVIKSNPDQTDKEVCTYCGKRFGFDYEIGVKK